MVRVALPLVVLNLELHQVPAPCLDSKLNQFHASEHFAKNNSVDFRCNRISKIIIDQSITKVTDQVKDRNKECRWSNREIPQYQEMTALRIID